MGTMRFESNEVGKPQANRAKVIHFDSTPQHTLAHEYGVQNIDLRDKRDVRGETAWDVWAQRKESDDRFSDPFKIGVLYYHASDWPGGPCRRNPVIGNQ